MCLLEQFNAHDKWSYITNREIVTRIISLFSVQKRSGNRIIVASRKIYISLVVWGVGGVYTERILYNYSLDFKGDIFS